LGTKKVPLPIALHSVRAAGALHAPHGTEPNVIPLPIALHSDWAAGALHAPHGTEPIS